MERITTLINGMSTTSSYKEGDCHTLINLRPKNGALVPVTERKIVSQLSATYEHLFIHSSDDYKNWIGVRIDGADSYIYADVNTSPVQIGVIPGESVIDVEQTGNVLSFISEESISYAIYRDAKYDFLGVMPELPVLHFQEYGKAEMASRYGYGQLFEAGTTNRENFREHTIALVNKLIDVCLNGGHNPDGSAIEGAGFGRWLFDAHFLRYAYRLYDGTLTKPSAPILIMPATRHILDCKNIKYSFDSNGVLTASSTIDVMAYNLWMSCNQQIDPKWKDLILSVDLFMSPPMGLSNIEYMRKDLPLTSISEDTIHRLIKEYPPEAMANIEENSLFYFVQSFEFPDSGKFNFARAFPDLDDEKTRIENLTAQELMQDSNMSNHRYAAGCSYSYNSRLHIGDVKTKMFDGWTPDSFLWLHSMYNGSPGLPSPLMAGDMIAEVEIETTDGLKRVYRRSTPQTGTGGLKLKIIPFVSYPDTRAKRMNFYTNDAGRWVKCLSFELKPHRTMNIAYHMKKDLYIHTGANLGNYPEIETQRSDAFIFDQNVVRASETNNPFVFPNRNVYQVGNGKVMAMASNLMEVAEWNYGQFPLYVFTNQGVWTMGVGTGEVAYSVLSSPTFQDSPISRVVCSTPIGVIFLAPKGIMIINGRSVQAVSDKIEQEQIGQSLFDTPLITSYYITPHSFNFLDFIQNIENISYNPREQEILFSGRAFDYNYVLNMPTSEYYLSTAPIAQIVKNNPTGLLSIDRDRTLRDYNYSGEQFADVCFITRPLEFGTDDIKRLERVIMKCNLYREGASSIGGTYLYASNDKENFYFIRGNQLNSLNFKNIDLGLLARVKNRCFVFGFGGKVSDKTQIFGLDSVMNREYNNTKLR